MTTVNLAYVDEFSTSVHQAYQAKQKLRDSVDLVTGIMAQSYQWPTLGESIATDRGVLGADLTFNAGAFGAKKAIAVDFYSADFVESFDQMKVNFSLSSSFEERMGKALGRKADQIIFDAIAADTGVTKAITSADTVSPALTLEHLILASGALSDDAVDMEDRFFVCHSKSLSQLLKDTNVTSVDYNDVRALVTGSINSFMGFKFITIANMAEGGLPLATNLRTNYAWHKSAIGYVEFGNGLDMKVNFSASKGGDIIQGKMSAGAVVKDVKGIVKVVTDESA